MTAALAGRAVPVAVKKMPPARILVTGTRHANDFHKEIIWDALDMVAFKVQHRNPHRSLVVVHGQCPQGGVDEYADKWAQQFTWVSVEPHPAEQHGSWPACGPRRNSHMVNLGAELCLGFPGPGSKGTWDCLRKAVDAGIPIRVTSLRFGHRDDGW